MADAAERYGKQWDMIKSSLTNTSAQEKPFSRRIIFADNVYSFKRLVNKINRTPVPSGNKFFLAYGQRPKRISKFLANRGFSPFPSKPFSTSVKEKFFKDYLEAFKRLAGNNTHSKYWQATHIASKNRFLSPLPELLKTFLECLEAIEYTLKHNNMLILANLPWIVSQSLQEISTNNGWEHICIKPPLQQFIVKLIDTVKWMHNILYNTFAIIIRIVLCRYYYGFLIPQFPQNKPVYVIKSFAYNISFSQEHGFKDPFFGDLRHFLSDKLQAEILTVVLSFKPLSTCFQKIRQLNEKNIIPLEAFLTIPDLIECVFEQVHFFVTPTVRVPDNIPFMGQDISELVKNSLIIRYNQIDIFQYLHYKAAKRMLRSE